MWVKAEVEDSLASSRTIRGDAHRRQRKQQLHAFSLMEAGVTAASGRHGVRTTGQAALKHFTHSNSSLPEGAYGSNRIRNEGLATVTA